MVGQSRDDVLTVVQAGGHHPGSQQKPQACSRYSPIARYCLALGGGTDVTYRTKLQPAAGGTLEIKRKNPQPSRGVG